MGVARDGGYTLDAEIERGCGEASFLEEGDEKRTEAGVDVERGAAAEGDFRKRGNVVDDAVGEVWSGANDLGRG